MGHVGALPSEVLSIVLNKVTTDEDSQVQDLCSSEAVCKEWKEIARESCWHALLKKVLGLSEPCRWDEAAWLIARFHKVRGGKIAVSAAKELFKLHESDLQLLQPAKQRVRQHDNQVCLIRHYDFADLLRAALAKYGSVELYREHVWMCSERASKRARTSFKKGVARREQVDEALKSFDEGVRGLVADAVENYVVRNRGTLEGVFRRATNIKERREDISSLLSESGLKLEDVPLCVMSFQLFEKGLMDRGRIVDELARHVALNEGLKARGVVFNTYSTSLSACRSYVRFSGQLALLLDAVEIREFYRSRMGCLDGENRPRALARWMQGRTELEILLDTPEAVCETEEFQQCLLRRFPAADGSVKKA